MIKKVGYISIFYESLNKYCIEGFIFKVTYIVKYFYVHTFIDYLKNFSSVELGTGLNNNMQYLCNLLNKNKHIMDLGKHSDFFFTNLVC